MSERKDCPVCGGPVRGSFSGEGTNHYISHAEAENERLREALREIVDRHDRPCGVHEAPLPDDVALAEIYAIARAVLGVEPPKEAEG